MQKKTLSRKIRKKLRKDLNSIITCEIKEIDKIVIARIVYGSAFFILFISGMYLVYYKISENIFDLNFYLVLVGVLISGNTVLNVLYHLRPSYIKNEKKKIFDVWNP